MTSLRAGMMFLIAVLATVFSYCSPRRPANVPEGAVALSLSSSGGWAYCWVDGGNQVNRCRTYSADGRRLYRFQHENDDDDVFLRYRGSGIVPENELKIDVVHSGKDYVWLESGIVLIPRNDFENQKQLIDELMRARAKGAP
jgi:hypothetical protein